VIRVSARSNVCVSEYCFLVCSLLRQTLTFSINYEGRIVREPQRGIAVKGASPFSSAFTEFYKKP